MKMSKAIIFVALILATVAIHEAVEGMTMMGGARPYGSGFGKREREVAYNRMVSQVITAFCALSSYKMN